MRSLRTFTVWASVFLAALALIAMLPDPMHAANVALGALNVSPTGSLGFLGTALAFAGVMKYRVVGVDYPALFQAANVQNAALPEAIPWIYYDTQNIATLVTSVNYFAATNADKTITNIEQPNTIAGEQYFLLYAITFDFLMGAANLGSSTTTPQFDDARIIMETSRATLSILLAQKLLARIPLAACHAIGGFQAWVCGNPANTTVFNAIQNMQSDGAWWCDGAIILPPKQSFEFTVTLASNALSATRSTRLALHGVLYRPVR